MNKIILVLIAFLLFGAAVFGEEKQQKPIKYVDPSGQYVHRPYDHNSEKAKRDRQKNYNSANRQVSQYKTTSYEHSKKR